MVAGEDGPVLTDRQPTLHPGLNLAIPDYSDDPALSAVVARIIAETERHVATTPHYANQLERMPRPWLLSCCNPPFCSCEEETVPEVVLDI